MDEIKITETVYKQSVALRGIQKTNKQTNKAMLRAEHLGTAFDGVFSGLLGQFTTVTYPRRLDHVTRDARAAWSARNNKV